jgi:uncharacterized membrane protein YheB (UPF0754 family)
MLKLLCNLDLKERWMLNKNFMTNVIAMAILLIGYYDDNKNIMMIGLFALSGAITNSLAIYMLFEKIPFMYGSGVIVNRFQEFKNSIFNLLMNEFFTKEHLSRFFVNELESSKNNLNLSSLINKSDLTPAFESLKNAVMESSFGAMLGMFGGAKALDSLKEPFEQKLKDGLITIVESKSFQEALYLNINSMNVTDDVYDKVLQVVKIRLEEFTPQMVKEIIQRMIKEHLGWLVVWGGIVGGLLGFFGSLLDV